VIYYSKQSISQEDIDAVVDVLKSDLITQGPVALQFEAAMCGYTGASHAIACSHGTAALHLACLALNIGKGDHVWTSPNSFVASANCALYCGAEIDFVDIDPNTLNISVAALSEKLEQRKKLHKLPKALILVHFAGNPCDMKAIHRLSIEYSFSIIEDASHALGASYQNRKIGDCYYSDITVFSFHPVKSITTGEGGMLMTNSKRLADTARLYANHGITRNRAEFDNQQEGEWFYEQKVLGFNYRITDIQAALGLSQLKHLDQFVAKRKTIAGFYTHELVGLPICIQQLTQDSCSSHHLYTISVQNGKFAEKEKIYQQMKAEGIICNCHYIPIHLQPYYQVKGFNKGDYPNAEAYYASSLSLPIYPDLKDEDFVVKTLKHILD